MTSRIRSIFRLSSRHLVVSGVCASVEYVTFLLAFQKIGVDLTTAYVSAFFLATTIGYLGHNYFTFKVKSICGSTMARFAMQAIVSLSIGYFLINIFLGVGIPVWIAKALQLVCTFVFNIIFGKYVTFRT